MKDLIGLIKYLLIIMLIMLFPFLFWLVLAFGFGMDDIFPFLNKISFGSFLNIVFGFVFACIWASVLLFIFAYYFILPIKITIKALQNHWSKYLDFFLNNIFLLTIILILLFKGLMTVKNGDNMAHIFNFETHACYIVVPCMFITPVYLLIYITAVGFKINKIKNIIINKLNNKKKLP